MSVEMHNYGPKYWEVVDKLSWEIVEEFSQHQLATKVDKKKIVAKVLSKNLRVLLRQHMVSHKEMLQMNKDFSEEIFKKNAGEICEKLREYPGFFNQAKTEKIEQYSEIFLRSSLVILVP
jgi:hypothetical protein